MSYRPPLETKHWHGREVRAYADRPHSIGELLATACARNPDGQALCTPSATYTYAQLHRRTAGFGAVLSSQLRLRPGDRMAILLPNQAEWVVAFFGGVLAGVVVVPLDARLTPAECEAPLAGSGVEAIVTTLGLAEPLRAIDLPALRGVFAVDSPGGLSAPHLFREPTPAGSAPSGRRPPSGTEDDVAAIFYTSGSTGTPKGAMLTHSNIIHAALNARRCVDLGADSRNLIVAPLSHVAACNVQLIASIATAGRADLLASFGADVTLEWMAEHETTHLFGVPAMYELLLTRPAFEGSHLPALRCCAWGGAPCSPFLGRRLRSALPGVRLGNGFGLTETASVVSFLADELVDAKPTSVGVPCPVNDVRIVDESGDDVPLGGAGELLVTGPTVLAGYEPRHDGDLLHDGWFRTGDIARMDAEGFIYIVDRAKDMIIRGGENIHCIEVEQVLLSHPAVAEAALVGVPDRVMGEEAWAIVVPEHGVSVDADALRQFCGQVLARFKVPKYLEVRFEPLPRTVTGKVVKDALRRRPGDR